MPSFFIEQFGCRATQADGAALERQLLDRGCTFASTASAADIVVVNTCTVTASADAQARDAIRKLHAAKPAVRLIVTGCYAQRAPEELAALPGVTWVVGNSHKPQIPQLIDSLSTAAPAESAKDFFPAAALEAKPLSLSLAPAKILTGDIFEQHVLLSAPVLGRSRTAATPVAPTASSPSSADEAAASRPTPSFTKSIAWPKRDIAKSFSAASTSALTAAIFRPASNSKTSSAASSAKRRSNAFVSAPSSRSTLRKI